MKVSDDHRDFEDNFDKAYAPYYQQKLPLKLAEGKTWPSGGLPCPGRHQL